MKKRVLCGCLVVCMIMLVSAITADATSLKGRFGLQLLGGYSWPNAKDYNEYWDDELEWLLNRDWDEGEVDKLESTSLFGVDLKYKPEKCIYSGINDKREKDACLIF